MAGDIATRYVRIRPDTTGFKHETNRQVEESLKGIRKTVGAAIGGLGIYEILKSTFEAAAHEQSAIKQIELAVKNAGSEWVVYGKTVKEILDEQEHAKGFDMPEQAQAFGRLEQQTKNTKLALADLSIAMDVSRARHLQLAQVATALSRLEGGNAQSLSRLGIITDKYSGAQDALKQQIHDVTVALQAQGAAHQKTYDGQLRVTSSQAALMNLSKSELKQREADLKAQLAGAAAADKQVTTQRARAELIKRYGGQAEAFAHTAAGQLAILHTSIEQVQEEIGNAFLPLLTAGAKDLSEWAYSLSRSSSFLHGTETAAHDLGQALHAIGDGIHAIEPLISVAQSLIDVIGVGPVLASVAAWKLLPPVLALAAGGEAALSADTQALQVAINGVQTSLDGFAAKVAAVGGVEAEATVATEGLTAAQGALVAEIDAAIIATDALFVAEEQLAGAQLQLTSSAELAAAAESTYGAVTAGTIAQHEAAAAAIEAETVAADAATASTRAAGVGLSGLLGPLALAAGAVYFLHEHFKTADHTAANFKTTIDSLNAAVKLSQADVTGARISKDQAKAQLESAKVAREAALERVRTDQTSTVGLSQLVTDQTALRDTTLSLRSATHAYANAVDEVKQREADRKKGLSDQHTELAALVKQTQALGTESARAAAFLAGHGKTSWLKDLDTHALDFFLKSLDKLAADNPSMTTAIEDLRGVAKAAHAIPDQVTIGLILNPSLSGAELTQRIVAQLTAAQHAAQAQLSAGAGGLLGRGGLAPLPVKSGADFAADFTRAGGVFPSEVKERVKKDAKAAAQTFSTSFVTHIDVAGIGDAIKSALDSARSNIVSQSDSIATVIGNALDERLRRTTLPLTREIKALQDQLDAESAASSAASAATALTDAQAKLAQLRSVYGSGALTAGQSKEISDATQGVADAQRAIDDNAKQARIASLQDQIDAAGKAEELRKQASSRNLADLADEFNRGRITQAQYLEGVRKVLADQKVSFKSAGHLLGVAFADGFGDALKNLEDQVLALTGQQRRGSTLTKPTSVTKAGRDATQSVLDQIAQSGGKFTLDNLDQLPKGVNVSALLNAAKAQRAEESYRVASGKAQQTGLQYAQETNRHLERIATLLQHPHVVVADGSKPKTRATAKATQS